MDIEEAAEKVLKIESHHGLTPDRVNNAVLLMIEERLYELIKEISQER